MPTTTASAQFDEAVKATTKAAQDNLDKITQATTEQLEKSYPQAVKGFQEYAAQCKESLNATAKSLGFFSKGFDQITTACMNYTQDAFESNVSAAKTLMNCKSLKEFSDVQSDVTKSSLDRFVAESTKISEMSVRVANQAAEPIQSTANSAFEKMTKAAKKAA